MSGSAIAGTDYQTLPGSITFAGGSATATQQLTAIDNNTITGTVNAIMTLSTNAAYAVGTVNSTCGVADGNIPTITIAKTADGAEGGANGVFTVTRSGNYRGTAAQLPCTTASAARPPTASTTPN